MKEPQPPVSITRFLFALLSLLVTCAVPHAATAAASDYQLFAHSNLVAWCIVPFDAKQRNSEARAGMLETLGFSQFAYDYRAKHIPTFDAEIETLARHHIRLTAWWFPTELNDEARGILDVLKRHDIKTQLWVMGGGEPAKEAAEQSVRVRSEAARIRKIAEAAAGIGCPVELYNHGGWFGEPENQIAIIELLRSEGITNVGIVYNQHHGHAHIDRFADLMQKMKPYLVEVNLNGMVRDGDKNGRQILPVGQGDLDLQLLKIIHDSGWRGPIGLINHTDEDAEIRLKADLKGLDGLAAELETSPSVAGKDYWVVESATEREKLPLYQTIPAAIPQELTPANGFPRHETFANWYRSHGDNSGERYSALDQINRKNVKELQVAWTYTAKDGKNNIQCNPIVAEGMMFAPTPGKHVVAVNAETGKEVWRFKPEGRPAFRGLIYRPETASSPAKLFFCAGAFLYALNPHDGVPIKNFGDGGKTKLPGQFEGDFGAATAAPVVFENIVVVAGFWKDVWAFDAVTGKQLWTFHTVPQEGEFGYDTWDKTEDYAANCWGGMALDEVRGIAYVSTGSPKSNFIGVKHLGQNLFANCVIALDARTGKRLWHFQEIRHDIWDLDVAGPPNLATITRDGRKVDVVTAVSKMGATLLLDRTTGKPIYPYRLRRAPTSDVPGELTSPYQPDPELPQPFARQDFTIDDITDLTPEAHELALSRFKSMTSGWFRPCSDGKMNLFYGLHGGGEWTGSCIDAATGKLYVSASHLGYVISIYRDDDPPDVTNTPPTRGQLIFETTCAVCHGTNRFGFGIAPPLRGLRHRLNDQQVTTLVRTGKNSMPAHPEMSASDLKALLDFLMLRDRPLPPVTEKPERPHYSFGGYPKFLDQDGYPANKPPWGTLHCIDLNTGKIDWTVPLGEFEELAAQGVKKTGTENFGGAIVTAGGLVFCAGTRDSKIRAFDKDTGEELWSAKLPRVGCAPPATYQVNGRQFLVIPAMGGGGMGTPTGDNYVAFALPAATK